MDGRLRKHIPDYPLVTEQGPMVVDVKPLHRLSGPDGWWSRGDGTVNPGKRVPTPTRNPAL
ncbi:hypothetical protein STRIP9103_04782 [Streptomyces ipomoeae 91-03]|uniref:Uncharacterized protein n=1 Tax=Streptomyces ipomoeae 91-03 TaxID=698759 RepID=L1KNQ8_9ACTN|nr:hypothetical protein STRIP9103_04782 [Streptomyces ipomoeae 91-03]